ncbi:LuxR C-terminal-related transcriptional regulator [Streptomyces lavendofoliae]|uniref:LuxR C-terminal-related transcriptional regulator n=1 Tax=Streptomyces lavendofoliae TaxID=67314 RepID=UPI00167BF05F|nr:LuxR C-terminal-related transcriptional regulator [Streptomyces lavendofoliae]
MPEHAEAVEIRAALLRLRRTTGLPIAFGGLLGDGRRMRIAEVNGALSTALSGLAIGAGNGLGGRAMALARPCAVTDYASARHISHEYDGPVAAEGLRSVLAVPVIVRRRVRGVLYGGLREPVPLGHRVLDAAVAAARDVEQALAVRDEAQRLAAAGTDHPPGDPARWEAVREAHGELRALAPRIGDPRLRAELLAVCERLAGSQAPSPAPGAATGPALGSPGPLAPLAPLAPREVDVLTAVAAGATNAGAAERLGLRPETVKGYLRSAMRKLGAHTRLEAVVAARRAGLLP